MTEETLDWGSVDIDDEQVSEKDLADAENMGRMPPMKFIGTCQESTLKKIKFKEYTCFGANLKWEIDELLQIDDGDGTKRDATDEDKERYEGRFVWDDVALAHPAEKQGMKNRRILISKRLGLYDGKTGKIATKAWSDLIIGAQAIITTEKNEYKDKNTGENKVGNAKVSFDGYEAVTASTVTDDFSDI